MKNPKLTVLIPTYNRALSLSTLLDILSNYQKCGLDFAVTVSDDNSHDDTIRICHEMKSKIQHFSYIKTAENKGMDNNFQLAYESVKTDYCWMLGDTRYIALEEMKALLSTLDENKYDAYILKCRDEIFNEDAVYTDINDLMNKQGWHITNNASCVIPKRFIKKELYHRYMGTTFLHQGIFVEGLCMQESFRVKYLSKIVVKDLVIDHFKKVGWLRHPFLNFGQLWCKYVLSLPNQITFETKLKVIKDHNHYTHILDVTKIPGYKNLYGQEFVQNYKENRQYLKYIVDQPSWLYDIAILMPSGLFRRLKRAYYLLKIHEQ
jgi:glycosyltransferase involved in cell wall biosynthesis